MSSVFGGTRKSKTLLFKRMLLLAHKLLCRHYMQVGFYQNAAALQALEGYQQAVAHNLASAGVAGFKRQVVGLQAQTAGIVSADNGKTLGKIQMWAREPHAQGERDFSAGQLVATGNPLDLAIEGDGFLSFKDPDGSTYFSRNGSLHINAEGQLVNARGHAVQGDGGEVRLNPGGGQVSILPDGTLLQGEIRVGRLPLTAFKNPAGLEQTGGSFRASASINPAPYEVESPRLLQGFSENANVNPLQEMVSLISISRAFEANQRVLTAYEDRTDRAIRALGPAT